MSDITTYSPSTPPPPPPPPRCGAIVTEFDSERYGRRCDMDGIEEGRCIYHEIHYRGLNKPLFFQNANFNRTVFEEMRAIYNIMSFELSEGNITTEQWYEFAIAFKKQIPFSDDADYIMGPILPFSSGGFFPTEFCFPYGPHGAKLPAIVEKIINS